MTTTQQLPEDMIYYSTTMTTTMEMMDVSDGDVERSNSLKHSVINLNNEAVEWLLQGSYRKATRSFLAAMENAKLLFSTKDQQAAAEDDMVQPRSRNPLLLRAGVEEWESDQQQSPRFFATVVIPCHSCNSPTQMTDSFEGMLPLFNQAFLLPGKARFDVIFDLNADIIPCILLYNIGLSLHLEGTQGHGTTILVQKSLGTFDLALAGLTGIQQQDEATEADIVLLFLAIVNNLACLHAQCCCNIRKAMGYVRLVQQMLNNQELTDALEDEIFDCFVLYLFLTPSMCYTAAPAA